MPAWQNEEDSDFVSTRTFDFHKLAEKFSTQKSSKRWSSDSNALPEDFVLSKSSDPLASTAAADSDSENEDEIFLVFRGKPNNRTSSFDECQAAAGVKIIYRLKSLTTKIKYLITRNLHDTSLDFCLMLCSKHLTFVTSLILQICKINMSHLNFM